MRSSPLSLGGHRRRGGPSGRRQRESTPTGHRYRREGRAPLGIEPRPSLGGRRRFAGGAAKPPAASHCVSPTTTGPCCPPSRLLKFALPQARREPSAGGPARPMNLLLCQAGDREVGKMRGDEERQAGFIVMTTLEDVVPDRPPPARDPRHGRRRARGDEPRARGPLRFGRPALDRPRVPAAGAARADPLRDPLRAPPGRAAALQPAAALVRRRALGRAGLARDHLHQEPRPPAQSADRRGLLRRDPRPGRGAQAAVTASTSPWTAP